MTPTPAAEKTGEAAKLVATTEAAKQLLLVMDINKSGKVSKEESMKSWKRSSTGWIRTIGDS